MEYATKAVGNAGLTTGIIGTALGVLNGGAGLLGMSDHASNYVTKDEMALYKELAEKDSKIAILTSEQNTEVKIADVYERIMKRVNDDARDQALWNANQSVINSQMSSAIAVNNNSIAALQGLTKIVVPADNVCPEPMPLKNSWTAPTA